MAVNREDLKTGTKIKVRGSFGNGPIVCGVVEDVEWDEDRQAYVVNYQYDGEGLWAYIDQVVEIIR